MIAILPGLGHLRRQTRRDRVDYELPWVSKQLYGVQGFRVPQVAAEAARWVICIGRCHVSPAGQGARYLPWYELDAKTRHVQLLPIPMQDVDRADISYHREGNFRSASQEASYCLVHVCDVRR